MILRCVETDGIILRRITMAIKDIRQKLFRPEYDTINAIIYATVAILIYALGFSSIEALPRLVTQINGVVSVVAITVFALYAFRNVDRLKSNVQTMLRVGHLLVSLGALGIVLQALLSASLKPLAALLSMLLIIAGLLILAALLEWIFVRSKSQVDRLIQDRTQIASRWFLPGTHGLVAMGMMRPKRRLALILSEFVVIGAAVVASFVLLANQHYTVGIALFVLIIAGVETLESVMLAEVVERKSVEGELNAARTIQMGLMPKEDPIVKGFDISGRCAPANEVGGDFFDYVWLDDRKTKFGIAMADVSGKALKAAMTAVMTSGMVYQEIGNSDSPRSILQKINRPMYLKTDRQVFTAMSFAVFDIRRKILRFSNAGQSQPMLLRGRRLSYIKVKGARLPLGVQEEQKYNETSVKLKSGDLLLFYTDGLPEATNAAHQLLGFEAVEEELVRHRSGSASEIVQCMTDQVSRHTGKTEQHDDMTVVVVKVA